MSTERTFTEFRNFSKSELIGQLNKTISDGKPTLIMITPSRIRAFEMTPDMDRWQAEGNVMHYPVIQANPSVTSLAEALNSVRSFSPQRIIAFGGGSAIDTAKGLSALLSLTRNDVSADEVRGMINTKAYKEKQPQCEIIAVPTTAGSGSDVTQWATIWDPEKHQKLSVDDPRLKPAASLISAELHAQMPVRLTLSTGLDALSHAMEAFWSKAHTETSRQNAIRAVTGIARTLPELLRSPRDLDLRANMAEHVLEASLAFSETRTTACHSISYPLTMRYGIEHGLACALTLHAVALRNLAAEPAIKDLLKPFGDADGFAEWLSNVTSDIQPLKLSAWDVPAEDLPEIARETFTKGRMDNNPVLFTEAEVVDILKEVYE